MDTNTLILQLVLGLAFLGVILFFGRMVMQRGGELTAKGPWGTVTLTGPEKKQVGRSLQAAVRQPQRRPEGVPQAEAELAATTSVRRASALWVDDNPDFNLYENLMLQDLGLSITQATSTESALEYLRHRHFSLVITDLTRNEDEEAGLSFVEALRKCDRRVPVIVYAFDPGDRAQRATELGVSHITVTPAQLLNAVLQEIRI
jgi:CheY-like chemotaxis protein